MLSEIVKVYTKYDTTPNRLVRNEEGKLDESGALWFEAKCYNAFKVEDRLNGVKLVYYK